MIELLVNRGLNRYFTLPGMSEKAEFAERLRAALLAAGYEPRPSVVEQNFNLRYWGRPVTFQAVRRWLRGESIPEQDKLTVLADWLGVEPAALRYGAPATGRQAFPELDGGKLGDDDRLLVRAVLSLSPARKKVLREIVQVFVEAERVTGKKER